MVAIRRLLMKDTDWVESPTLGPMTRRECADKVGDWALASSG